jgi:hypothetical protein
MFSQEERRFLSQKHGSMVSVESMNIPEKILEGILSRRARTLGEAFEQFKATQAPDRLELDIAIAKLF